MFIDYISDIHVDHYIPFTPNQKKWEKMTRAWTKNLLSIKIGEVLIVAGDISSWPQQTKWFLKEASLLYDKVFYTFGNHDYYLQSKNQQKKYDNSIQKINSIISDLSVIENLTVLNKNIEEYKGIVFAGHSMWYNLVKDEDILWYTENSNDKVYIIGDKNHKDAHKELYKESIDWYHELEDKDIDVFVSHFPPMNPPNSNWEHIEAYVTDVPFLVGKHWVSGHQHTVSEYNKYGVNFYMNPIGYPNEGLAVEVKTFKINK